MGPKAGLDRCGKSWPHRDSIPGPSSPWRVAIPIELWRSVNRCISCKEPACLADCGPAGTPKPYVSAAHSFDAVETFGIMSAFPH